MKLHEYQAKELLRKRGVYVLDSQNCFTVEEGEAALKDLGFPAVVKAQVHAGGRKKAGGVKVVNDLKEGLSALSEMFDLVVKNEQTTSAGQVVSSILVERGCQIAKEYYVCLIIDRNTKEICLISSEAGGIDIEEVAATAPDKIKKLNISTAVGVLPFQIRDLATDLNIDKKVVPQFVSQIEGLYRTFIECDASMLEINPMAITKDNKLVALDAKMALDENALFRRPALTELRDPTQEDEKELEAQSHNLNYVALDGEIGCMVNGAGLAMATMDIIRHVGGKPANFLDVGGSATKERVSMALKIIAKDENVKTIFINIFGGIAKCDVIASGVVEAVKEIGFKLPIVMRLEGTNVDLGKQIVKESGLNIESASNMLDGAKMALNHAR